MLALGAQVAIVLHVAAVELDELRVGVADGAGQRIGRLSTSVPRRPRDAFLMISTGDGGSVFAGLTTGRIENFSRHRANTVRQR